MNILYHTYKKLPEMNTLFPSYSGGEPEGERSLVSADHGGVAKSFRCEAPLNNCYFLCDKWQILRVLGRGYHSVAAKEWNEEYSATG